MIEHFAAAGFDLVHPFDARAVAHDLGLALLADNERPCGWLVGNTRALWPRLRAARAADPALAASTDPIERYLEQTCASLVDVRCVFAHRRYDGAFLPFQRIAVATGFGTLAPTQLVIHPIYGPWFALRAVVLARGTPITRVLPAAACDCANRCGAAFEQACARDSTWRDWLAVRDACCVGIAHRYDDDQIEYHYTKSLLLLGQGSPSPSGASAR
jgi:cyanocobalamin reductase (cyanide-eliminating) / alkylcobalamin dealkylase